jgi:uncharacterized DUF497 family protein
MKLRKFLAMRLVMISSPKAAGGENVYRALGQTDGGRYLAVFFIYKRDRKALPISARDMDGKERKGYGKE